MVLGHGHADHRGTAPRWARRSTAIPTRSPTPKATPRSTPTWNLGAAAAARPRSLYPLLLRRWDGGAVKIDGTVDEGDRVAGFEVVHFPGHARGLIGLWRESDRLALVSDVIYLVDSVKLGKPLPPGEASVPHPAWAWDHAEAKESVRKLAALDPAIVGAGHAEPLRGESLRATLERAAEKY